MGKPKRENKKPVDGGSGRTASAKDQGKKYVLDSVKRCSMVSGAVAKEKVEDRM